MSALHQKDAYKIGHINQYPVGTTEIYSNLTARSGNYKNVPTDGVCFIGVQYFVLDYLINEWNITFFNKDKSEVCNKYKRRVSKILGYDVDVSHIENLHDLGYLPVVIKALPEGSFVPYGIPLLTIKNTLPEFYWVTNMLESVMSAELWQPITSATTYMSYKRLFHKFADITGSPKEFISYQGHDFSFRGMAGRHAAAISGFAVLGAGAIGTDCIPAIDIAEDFYGADVDKEIVGETINSTEHSVQSSNGKETEYDTYVRFLTEVYPSGMVGIVSDTWDFWNVIDNYLPRLKSIIMARDGKLVLRPDSGNPVDVICGTVSNLGAGHLPEEKGLIECLWNTFGGTINEKGYKVLDSHIGAIYGDSITWERAHAILEKLEKKGFASCNIVLGIGSYSYQLNSRDTHGMAVKSTHAIINGIHTPIFKEPKTDTDNVKKSAKGYLMVSKVGNEYKLWNDVDQKQESHGCLEIIFKDGKLIKRTTLSEIRGLTKL